MKYVVVLCDGMADYAVPQLDGKTPMMVADKKNMDFLAKNGKIGLAKTVDDTLSPGSDVANLAAMGYNPLKYYTGRSPLEAVSMGINLDDSDVTVRCNLVTLSDDQNYEDKTMVDYCADDISTAEAKVLINAVEKELGNEIFKFYPGVSYRHCLVWKNGVLNLGKLTPPHDISDKKVTNYLPNTKDSEVLLDFMKKSYNILKDHPVNIERVKNGRRPANSIWLWGQGSKPLLDSFYEKYGLKGSVVSAVDLIKGIGLCASMTSCDVEGATGYIDTNFEGKAQACLDELARGQDFVYIHIEAPDECGHRYEINNKVKAIEEIDKKVLATLIAQMDSKYDDYKIMILPDHPTPLVTKTHARDAVPYLIYHKNGTEKSGVECFTEQTAKESGNYIENGFELMELFTK